MKSRILFGIIGVLVFYLPFFFLGENSHIPIRDVLNGDFVHLSLLKSNNLLLALNDSSKIPNIFNGISRDYFHSEYSMMRVLFYFFPEFWAYVLNSIIIRVVGFTGMTLLLRDYFFNNQRNNAISFLIPLAFAILPLFNLYGLSVMGQPILFWAFLNLNNHRKKILSYSIILLFPFYSVFALAGPFILFALFIYGLTVYYNSKKYNSEYWLAFFLLSLVFIIANKTQFKGFLFNEVISHRVEMSYSLTHPLKVLWDFIKTILKGHYHSSSIDYFPITFLALFVIWKYKDLRQYILPIFCSILLISAFYSSYRYFTVPLEENIHFLTEFQLKRFTFLLPFLNFLILLYCFKSKLIPNKLMLISVIILIVLIPYRNKEILYNYSLLIAPESASEKAVSFNAFFSKSVFEQIENYIALPQEDYRIVSLGFFPSVTQYNGFYTLDSYQNYYPLAYKDRFEKIIEKELVKNEFIYNKFHNWGSHCFVFSAELQETCYLDCHKEVHQTIKNFELNTDELRKLGGDYLFSAVRIENFKRLNLSFEGLFEDNDSRYRVYLYKLT